MSEVDYKNIKKGDILYESSYGITIEVRVKTDPVFKEIPESERDVPTEWWNLSFTAESSGGDIDYLISPTGLMYNVGRLYSLPAYAGTVIKLDGTVTEANIADFFKETIKEEWKQYKRKELSEMRPYINGESLEGVSISEVDQRRGSPKTGDMIARNPQYHVDQWLVAKKYFDDNFELA